jgi:hypothetical protein
MIMDNEQQKIDIRISDIIVSIAPAAVKTLIAVTSSLGTLQVDQEREFCFYYIWIVYLFRQRLKMKKKKLIRNLYLIQNHLKIRIFGLHQVY